jgi:hypothetical protein
MKWLAGYFYIYVLGSYSSYDHYPFDPSKPEHTILTVVFDVFAIVTGRLELVIHLL